MRQSIHAISVKDLTKTIKALLESSALLSKIWIRGEISNYKRHSSGHLYFTLKDDASAIRCVMFRSRAASLRFEPANGMAVLLFGSVSVYERDGQYQVYVDEIEADGVGSLYQAYVQLKDKLEQEGLFDAQRKRALPAYPRRIGVVTSLKGAAVRDIIRVATRRWPNVSLVIADVLVQGEKAPQSIIAGLDLISKLQDIDVIIVGRGGGSIEDLWAFNSEQLARAIAACAVPVVSAVGHETDFTIADFAADLRAATPSAAAELLVLDHAQTLREVSMLKIRLVNATKRSISLRRNALSALLSRAVLRRGSDLLNQKRQATDDLTRNLQKAAQGRFEIKVQQFGALLGRLDALSPLKTLERGYSICSTPEGRVITDANSVSPGAKLRVRLSRGELDCVVNSKILHDDRLEVS